MGKVKDLSLGELFKTKEYEEEISVTLEELKEKLKLSHKPGYRRNGVLESLFEHTGFNMVQFTQAYLEVVTKESKLPMRSRLLIEHITLKAVGKALKILQENEDKLLIEHYLTKVVPEIRKGLRKIGTMFTEAETDRFLRGKNPKTIEDVFNPNDGTYTPSVIKISKLSTELINNHIEFCKKLAAKEFGICIQDPKFL